jgi:hypothetical protein
MRMGQKKRRTWATKRYMRTMVILMFMSFVSPLVSQAQSVSTPESPAPARMYYSLREEDDWSFLADPAMRKDFWDPIKYIRLRSGRNDWFLSIAGDAREVGNRSETTTGANSPS